jgi:ElaA protein
MTHKLEWRLQTFEQLSNEELYQLLRLRCEVFVLEQKCCFLDLDNKDQKCHHLSGYLNGELMAVSRIVPPGISYSYPSIGRIAVSGSGRGIGLGIELLNVSIEKLEMLYGKSVIRIGAQLYLEKFYGAFHFERSGPVYLEDDIEHIEMTRQIR